MRRPTRILTATLIWTLLAGIGLAGEPPEEDAGKNAGETAGTTEENGEPVRHTEDVVVTASRTELPLHEAPSSVSVIGADEIETAPADDFGDLLRNVPGLNVAQFSAGDIQFNTRQGTGLLAQGQQILIDNRSVIYDFNGIMVLPSVSLDPSDVERIEAVRGPGSAVWGAGATNGVVNIITKRPQDMIGNRLTVGGGQLGTTYGNFTHADAAGELSWRVSATWFEQSDAYDRPTGTIPGTEGPGNPGGTPYPVYPDLPTNSTKLDIRVDYDIENDSYLSVSGGFATFQSTQFVPGGPASWDDGSDSWYVNAQWTRGSLEVRGHATVFDGTGVYWTIPLPGGDFLRSLFASESYHLEAVDTHLAGTRHLLTYGGNARTSRYDLEIGPQADKRDELGAFVQDDIRLSEKWRWLVGARFDDISNMGTAFSPRTSLMYEPVPGQSVRLSWNRSFRAPTILQNFLEYASFYPLTLPDGQGGTVDLNVPLVSVPNTGLVEERLDALELAWVANLGDRITLTASLYEDDIRDVVRLVPSTFYDSSNSPPGWPLPNDLLDVPPPGGFGGVLPATLAFQNVGRIENRGVEASVEVRPSSAWRVWVNTSWQDEPEIEDVAPFAVPDGTLIPPVNLPPAWRANAGAVWNPGRYWIDLSANYQDDAFWTDHQEPRFWGPTDSFLQFNLGAGIRLVNDTVTVSLQAQNLTDEDVQQYVLGDLLGRKVSGQVTFRF